jgi:tRNA (adenine37-N6)-methyltransferase
MDFDVCMHAIGVVRTSRTELAATPIQSSLNRAEHGTIEIDGRYAEGLAGLADFDYAWMLTWLDRPDDPGADPPLRHVPFLLRREQREMGVFAARGPRHINPIGLSLIQLLDVTGPAIRFAGVDVLDGTPVIDLKPYVARFDRPPGEPRCGWFDHVPISDGLTPADLLPSRHAPGEPPQLRQPGCTRRAARTTVPVAHVRTKGSEDALHRRGSGRDPAARVSVQPRHRPR